MAAGLGGHQGHCLLAASRCHLYCYRFPPNGQCLEGLEAMLTMQAAEQERSPSDPEITCMCACVCVPPTLPDPTLSPILSVLPVNEEGYLFSNGCSKVFLYEHTITSQQPPSSSVLTVKQEPQTMI